MLEGRAQGGRVRMVRDGDYRAVVLDLADGAIHRLWCSLFIVDPTPASDPDGAVREVIRAVAGAVWRGVDTRLLIGGSDTNLEIAAVCAASLTIARRAGIPTRSLIRPDTRGSHSKVMISDTLVLTGSHNWSGGAMSSQTQDSVLVESADVAAMIVDTFLWQWRRARRES